MIPLTRRAARLAWRTCLTDSVHLRHMHGEPGGGPPPPPFLSNVPSALLTEDLHPGEAQQGQARAPPRTWESVLADPAFTRFFAHAHVLEPLGQCSDSGSTSAGSAADVATLRPCSACSPGAAVAGPQSSAPEQHQHQQQPQQQQDSEPALSASSTCSLPPAFQQHHHSPAGPSAGSSVSPSPCPACGSLSSQPGSTTPDKVWSGSRRGRRRGHSSSSAAAQARGLARRALHSRQRHVIVHEAIAALMHQATEGRGGADTVEEEDYDDGSDDEDGDGEEDDGQGHEWIAMLAKPSGAFIGKGGLVFGFWSKTPYG